MSEEGYYQSMKRLNFHSDIVLRTPTFIPGERMLRMANKDPMNSFNCIMNIAYPKNEKKTPDCIEDLRSKANRNILIIHEVESLNGLFGLQQSLPMTDDTNTDSGQLWAARTVNNCNLVELPKSVSELLTLGDDRRFNFVESMMTLNLRKEAENCLPAAFQFWAIPKVKKLLDEKIKLLVFGGKWSLNTGIEDTYNQGILPMLLSAMKLQDHILQCEHYNETVTKDSFIDTTLEKIKAMDKNEQNIFLMKELENMLLECKNPSDYIMDLFVKDLLQEDFCIDKQQYRRRKNIFLTYRGLFFLIERRFEVFMNVVLFQQIIHNNIEGVISEEMILCLIRAGMVLTNVSFWKTFAIARDSSYEVSNIMKYTRRAKSTEQIKSRKITNAEAKKFEHKEKSSNATKYQSRYHKCDVDRFVISKQSWGTDIGYSSDTYSDLENSCDSQETISEELTETEINPEMSKPKSGKGKRRIIRTSSDSEEFSYKFKLESQSMKSKGVSSDRQRSTNAFDLKSQENKKPVFKSIRETKISKKTLTKPSQVFSDNNATMHSVSSNFGQKMISALDKESINIIETNTSNISNTAIPDMLNTKGADRGTNTRSLRPREHMDKLSKYMSNNIIICNAD